MPFESTLGAAVPEQVPQKKEAVLSPITESALRIAEQRQEQSVVEAEHVEGFDGMKVAFTLEKSLDRRYGESESPNQDFAWINPEQKLLICSDGLGGHTDGHTASKVGALQIDASYSAFMESDVEKLLHKEKTRAELIKDLTDAFEVSLSRTDDASPQRSREAEFSAEALIMLDPVLAYKTISLIQSFQIAHKKVVRDAPKGGTTACAAVIHVTPDGRRWPIIANIGDGNALIQRAGGIFEPVTEEDSAIRDLLKNGLATPHGLRAMRENPTLYLPPHHEKTRERNRYNVIAAGMTDCLGMPDYSGPSFTVCELFPQDTLLLCTDGTTDKYKNATHTYLSKIDDPFDDKPDGEEMAKQFSTGEPLTEHLNALREDASRRKTFKLTDDQALIAVTVLE